MKTLSVVIISHNQEWQLDRIVNALNRQTIKPEIIMIKDMERASARNYGYKKASGNIVVFLDGDTIPLHSDYLEIIQNSIEDKALLMGERPIDITKNMIDSIDETIIKQLFPIEKKEITNWGLFQSNNFAIIKTNEDLFDENFIGWGHEDIELAYRYQNNGYKIISDSSLICGHFGHEIPEKNKGELLNNSIYFLKKYPQIEVHEKVSSACTIYGIDIDKLNYIWTNMRKNANFIADKRKHILEIEITHKCNLYCKNCCRMVDQFPDETEMELDSIKSLLAESEEINHEWIQIRLSGGEPTLHPKFNEIVELLSKYKQRHPDCNMLLLTNGIKKVTMPAWFEVLNSNKSGIDIIYHDPIYQSLEDYNLPDDGELCDIKATEGENRLIKIRGIILNRYGLSFCGIYSAINRILKVDKKEYWSLREFLNDFDKLDQPVKNGICEHCGFTYGIRGIKTKDKISKFWGKMIDCGEN